MSEEQKKYPSSNYNLPAGFKKCVYLQSDGTQWINTGVIPDNETGLYFNALQLTYGNFIPFGVSESGNAIYPPRFSSKDLYYRWGGTAIKMMTWDKAGDLIFHSSLNLYNSKIARFDSEDTDVESSIISQTGTYTLPIWLFSYNYGGTYTATYGKWAGHVYRAQITQGDALIHDYVPCLDTDNRPCMYDLIEQEALYNQSGGAEFTYCVEHQLPSDFIKLKYLESTGTQYIKTGYVPTNTTGLYIDTQDVGSGDTIPMGSWNSTSTNTRFFITRQTSSKTAGYGWGAWTQISSTTGSVRYDSTLNWLNDRKSITNNPLFVTVIKNLGELSFTPQYDIWMFGVNHAESHDYKFKGRIYRAKISEGNEIIRDFVPAFDERKSKSCMYDLINNVAYYNNGAGEFLTNRDFEGTYKGYRLLSTVGNRLGYGEPIRGIGPETLGVTLLDGPLTLEKNTYINTLLETANSNMWGTFDFTVPYYDAGGFYTYTCTPIGYIDDSSNIQNMYPINMKWSGSLLTLDSRLYAGYFLYTQLISPGGRYQFKIDKNNICTIVNDNELIVDKSELPYTDTLIYTPKKYFVIIGDSEFSDSLLVHQMQFLDKEGKIMGDMYPAEKDGQYGLYCMIRNIFLPVQTS